MNTDKDKKEERSELLINQKISVFISALISSSSVVISSQRI
jgi:hypothetical protein